jgi:hypothetical protein
MVIMVKSLLTQAGKRLDSDKWILASLAARVIDVTRVAAPNTDGCQSINVVMTAPKHNAPARSCQLLPFRGMRIGTEKGRFRQPFY